MDDEMDDQDEICLCFHVSVQKVKKFIRLQKPVRESQLSECYGAGTGCGWCRPFLKSLFEQETSVKSGDTDRFSQMSSEEYALQRKNFRLKSESNEPDDHT